MDKYISMIFMAFNSWRLKKPSIAQIVAQIFFRLLGLSIFIVVYVFLFFLRPIKEVKFGFLHAKALGHLALNLDLFLRRRQLGIVKKNAYYLFFVYKAGNRQLLKMFKRLFDIVEIEWLGKLLSFFCIFNTKFCQHLQMNSNEYLEYRNTACELYFTKDEEEYGREELLKMGITDNDWFVCIFARDSEHYRKTYGLDSSSMDCRDADIDTYIDAVKYIVGLGGYVLRMGMNVNKPFGFTNERVIDYAITNRSDFMDVYLTAKCRFFIGTSSGGADMARIFDKYHLAVNWTPIGWGPWGKNELYMPKTLVYRSSGEQVPYEKALKLTQHWLISLSFNIDAELEKLDMQLISNTPGQILAATKEMIARLEGKHIESQEYLDRLNSYFKLRKEYDNWCKYVYSPLAENYILNLKLK